MKYDLDTPVDRRNTDSLKWNVSENELPMWVADMDFKTAPHICDAIQKRAEQGIFGYCEVPDEWYKAYTDWWQTRHGFSMEKDWLIFCTGVVPAISSIVRKVTTPAEKVVVLTPVYNIFFNSIENNGRQVLECPLKYDGREYTIDLDDLERKLSDPQTAMLLLCNPHNPVGKIWGRDTLEKVGELCSKYNVIVLSDEIHCDITDPDAEYIPFASVSEKCRDNSITCIAPTKAFNLAGLQTAAAVVPNKFLRHKVWRGFNTDEIAEPNVFAATAAAVAFSQGGEWLDELRQYIYENKKAAEKYINENIPLISVVPSQATYLLWLDCGKLPQTSTRTAALIRRETGLYLSDGKAYRGNGKDFLRMNIACPRSVLYDGLERLKNGIALCTEQK